MTLQELIASKRVLLCCGSGGVGKTSVSASLGLAAALQGRKVCVLTIDPARRLATAMGIDLEENAQNKIAPETFEAAGLKPRGELYATMLHAKKTFDELVAKYASSPEARDRLLGTPAYQHGSAALTDSPEYMATEKLYELYHECDYDLIIVDTPPLKHALDFLTAPTRFQGMLTGNPMIRMLVDAFKAAQNSRGGFLQRLGKASMFRILSMVTGEKAIRDAGEFFSAFADLMGGFTDRAQAIERLFQSDDCALLVVTSPNLITIEEALFLHEKITGYGMHNSGFIVNRVEPNYFRSLESEPEAEKLLGVLEKAPKIEGVPGELMHTLVGNMRHHEMRRRTEDKNVALLERQLSKTQFIVRVPELPKDVADLKGLSVLAGHLNPQD